MNTVINTAPTINFMVHDTVASTIDEMFQGQRKQFGEKTNSLKYVFNLGFLSTDYSADPVAFETLTGGNGTGYYDPIISMVFFDKEGVDIEPGKTISIYDTKSKRQLYVVVIHPGLNVIYHERYSAGDALYAIVMTTNLPGLKDLSGMNPCWSENVIYDLVRCSALFGFEFDRFHDSVYVPFSKPKHSFEQAFEVARVIAKKVENLKNTQEL